MHSYKSLANSGLSVFLGTAVAQASLLASLTALSHITQPQAYGEIIYYITTIQLFTTVVSGGLGLAITKYTAEYYAVDKLMHERFQSGLLALSYVFIAASVLILNFTSASDIGDTKWTSVAASLSVIFLSLDSINKSLLIGALKFNKFLKANIYGGVLFAIAPLFVIYICGEEYFGFGLLAGYFFQYASSKLVMHSTIVIKVEGLTAQLHDYKVIGSFIAPSLLANIVVIATIWLLQYSMKLEGDSSEIAKFGIAWQWFNLLLFIPTVAGKVIVPHFTVSLREGKHEEVCVMLNRLVIASGVILGLASIAIYVFSPMIDKLYDEKYYGIGKYIFVASIAAMFGAMAAPVGNLLAAKSLMKFGAATNLIWSFVIYLFLQFSLGDISALKALYSLCAGYIIAAIVSIVLMKFIKVQSIK